MEGQITKILSNLYFITSSNRVYECSARGKFRHQKITPVVGDYVIFNESEKYITEILPRKNFLIRPLVSNIDQGVIVTSLSSPDFSTNLLDKLILIAEYNKITPIICITKEDLLNDNKKEHFTSIINYYRKIGYLVLYNTELDDIKKLFKDKTTVFMGQTGSGKSTLLNKLDSNLNLETDEISKALGRGKHTTRFVQLLSMFDGKVLDTPGFSSIDLSTINDEDIGWGFIEFKNHECKFRDCKHINEQSCAVKEAVESGDILDSRYENYKKFISGR